MKIRLGFVSNSSSSSFICAVCGEVNSGWDADLSDFDMLECKNGHIVCESHISKDKIERFAEKKCNDNDDDEPYIYATDSEFCPVCCLDSLPDKLLLEFVLKNDGVAREEVTKEIRKRFQDYKSFEAFLNG